MIDCALIRQMIRATARKLSCKESIAAELAAAISPFSPTHELGGDSVESDPDENPVQLRDGLVFFAQSDGQGYKAQEITDEVWVKWREWQLEEIGQPEE